MIEALDIVSLWQLALSAFLGLLVLVRVLEQQQYMGACHGDIPAA
jgi:hypothetical protein